MYIALEKPPRLKRDFTKALEIAPKEPSIYFGRAQAEITLKKFDEAIADVDKTIELKPDTPEVYKFRGFADIGKAIGTLRLAISTKQSRKSAGRALIRAPRLRKT